MITETKVLNIASNKHQTMSFMSIIKKVGGDLNSF